MKTIYILSSFEGLIKDIQKEIEKFKTQLEIVGTGPLDENTKQDCSFKQPDFIITENLSVQEAKELHNLCVNTLIIMISTDMNRANSTINSLQMENLFNVTAVDVNNTTPYGLLTEMALLDNNTNTNENPPKEVDDFEEAVDNTTYNSSDASNKTMEKTEEKTDEPIVEKTDDVNISEVQLNENSNLNNEEMMEEETFTNDKRQTFNLNLNNVRTKMITFFSKKGGTGKSNIAKEIGNIYSSIKLPKKLQSGSQFLRTCLVDLDFESSSLRTFLGITNPSPNIYLWIGDIIDRLENKTPIDKIYFNQFQVMSYLTKIENASGNYYALIAGQGNLPLRLLQRLSNLDDTGELLSDVIKLILTSLKRTFDVVIVDCESNYNEISHEAMKMSDNILYVLNPTVADIDNLKIFTDEIAITKEINLNNVGLILNKMNRKININANILDLLSLIKYQDVNFDTGKKVDKHLALIADIPEDVVFINCNNNYEFVTNNSSPEVKKGILKICEYCVPIFKVKYTSANMKELERLKQIKEKKKQLEEMKNKKKKALEELAEKKKQKKNKKVKTRKKGKEKITSLKEGEAPLIEEKAIDNNENIVLNENKNTDVEINSVENNSENSKQTNENSSDHKIDANDYLNSDLKNETLEKFVENLRNSQCKKTRTNYPILTKKPKSLNKKVWKLYSKELNKQMKLSLKMKREEMKNK